MRAKTSYDVVVPIDPCAETDYGETEDYTVVIVESGLGLIENHFPVKPIIYPNPTDGNFSIDLITNYNDIVIKINDLIGRDIVTRYYDQGQQFNLNLNNQPGIYFLTIIAQDKKAVFRVIKK